MMLLDFFSGSHGHFLEYVINSWLFKGPRVKKNIFTHTGACHGPHKNLTYLKNRIICADHYSEFNKTIQDPSKVVRITINKNWAQWIYQINVMSRAGDIPIDKKLELIPPSIRSSPALLRNQWYAKFNFAENGYNVPNNWRWPNVPYYSFPMESLFDQTDFLRELYQLSKFLEITFSPDHELTNLLDQFLEKNQGWQYYKISKQLVVDTFNGKSTSFDSDEITQALINTMLSESVGMFDGALFEDNEYAINTDQVWQQVSHHLKSFDSKF